MLWNSLPLHGDQEYMSLLFTTDESKFKFMYTYSEYDVIRVIVKGINDMYNARNELLNNKQFVELM